MKNLNIRALLFSILGTLSFFFGCVRDEPTLPENYSKYPIEVKSVELPDGSTRLTWNAIKTADFVEYQVLKRTGDTVPFIADSSINRLSKIATELELAKRIADVDSTFFVDSFSVPATRTFLRVFAVLKNRNLSSKNVELTTKTDAKELEINPIDVLYIPEERKVIVGDGVAAKMAVFSIPAYEFQSLVAGIPFANNLEMTYNKNNGATELLVPNGFQINVRKLDGSLILGFNNQSFTSFDAVFCDKSTNFITGIGSSQGFPVINCFNRATLVNSNTSGSSPSVFSTSFSVPKTQALYVFRPARLNREVIALSITNNNADIQWLRIDSLGRSVTKTTGLNSFVFNITKRPFAVNPDNQGFITSGKGLIFSRGMALVDSLKLPEPEVRYTDMIYSEDGAHLLATRNPTERREKKVDVYSYPGFRFERSIAFKSTPLRIFQDGNFLVLVGRSPNSPRKTMIEKIPY
jgi:hypothetical protein